MLPNNLLNLLLLPNNETTPCLRAHWIMQMCTRHLDSFKMQNFWLCFNSQKQDRCLMHFQIQCEYQYGWTPVIIWKHFMAVSLPQKTYFLAFLPMCCSLISLTILPQKKPYQQNWGGHKLKSCLKGKLTGMKSAAPLKKYESVLFISSPSVSLAGLQAQPGAMRKACFSLRCTKTRS